MALRDRSMAHKPICADDRQRCPIVGDRRYNHADLCNISLPPLPLPRRPLFHFLNTASKQRLILRIDTNTV